MEHIYQNYRYINQDVDYTFRFYPNGHVVIMNNATNEIVLPKQLSGSCLQFFARKKIQFIKQQLQIAIHKAG
jgi:hypothetical protein